MAIGEVPFSRAEEGLRMKDQELLEGNLSGSR